MVRGGLNLGRRDEERFLASQRARPARRWQVPKSLEQGASEQESSARILGGRVRDAEVRTITFSSHTSTLHTWHIHTTHASRVVTAQCHQPDTGARCPPTDVHMSPRRLASPTQTETERTQNSSRLVSRASSRPLARLAQPTLGSAHPSIGLAPRNTRWPHCTCATRKRSPATALIHTRAMRPPGAIKRLAGQAGGAHLHHTCAWLAGPNGHYRIARCGRAVTATIPT